MARKSEGHQFAALYPVKFRTGNEVEDNYLRQVLGGHVVGRWTSGLRVSLFCSWVVTRETGCMRVVYYGFLRAKN